METIQQTFQGYGSNFGKKNSSKHTSTTVVSTFGDAALEP
jgi:hypothetical protein